MAAAVAADRPQYKIQADQSLIDAVLNSDIGTINKSLAAGANIDYVDTVGRFPLAIAAAKGDISVLNRLLHMSANPATRGGDGHSALYAAVSQGHDAIVKRLLIWGGSDAEDMGATAMLACQRDRLPLCVQILKKLARESGLLLVYGPLLCRPVLISFLFGCSPIRVFLSFRCMLPVCCTYKSQRLDFLAGLSAAVLCRAPNRQTNHRIMPPFASELRTC